MDNNLSENFELTMPVNPAYVSAVRLTASSISNRLKFSVDEIEEIKTAVSEACAYIIKRADPAVNKNFKINFKLDPDRMEIFISMPGAPKEAESEKDLSLIMIEAMVDSLEIADKGGKLDVIMVKNRKGLV